MKNINFGEVYTTVGALLDANGFREVSYCVRLDRWNHRDSQPPVECEIWVAWEPGEYYRGATFEEALDALRAEIATRAADVMVEV